MLSLRKCSIVAAVVMTTIMAFAACGDSNVKTVKRNQSATGDQSQDQTAPHDTAGAATTAAAGITWTVPAGWHVGPARRMRVATYLVGEKQDANCAVFYFGPGQGGGIQANIDRWVGQFNQPDGSESSSKARISKHKVSGLAVTTIDLSGIYTASMGGSMSGQKANLPGYRMLGAIIEAPEGPVFFKLVGPDATVVTALDDFQQLVESVKKS